SVGADVIPQPLVASIALAANVFAGHGRTRCGGFALDALLVLLRQLIVAQLIDRGIAPTGEQAQAEDKGQCDLLAHAWLPSFLICTLATIWRAGVAEELLYNAPLAVTTNTLR